MYVQSLRPSPREEENRTQDQAFLWFVLHLQPETNANWSWVQTIAIPKNSRKRTSQSHIR